MAACAAVVTEFIAAMLVLTMVGPMVAATLARFDAYPPPLTRWVLNIPPVLTVIVLTVLIVAVLVKERLITDKRMTLMVNLVLLAVSFAWIPLLVIALFMGPAEALARSID